MLLYQLLIKEWNRRGVTFLHQGYIDKICSMSQKVSLNQKPNLHTDLAQMCVQNDQDLCAEPLSMFIGGMVEMAVCRNFRL